MKLKEPNYRTWMVLLTLIGVILAIVRLWLGLP
jgi:hypothetical protein